MAAFRYSATLLSLALCAIAMDASAAGMVSGTSGRHAQNSRAVPSVSAAPASPKERGELTRQFVTKWGNYVQRVYGVPLNVWASRMVPNFVAADAGNFRNALNRDTFEGAIAELSGTGQRISDDRVITQLARATKSLATANTLPLLGNLSNDLVYTPIQPCRILDTRNTGPGPIAANGTRSFVSINQANFTLQGGSATDCGTLGLNATAVAINLTAVTPTGDGYATAYPFGSARPLAATINYATGQIINNQIIAQIPNPLTTSDFTVYSFAQAHYVADIVGYFAPPQATPLGCTSTFVTQTVTANQPFDIQIPACAAGYTLTGAGCRTPGFNEASWSINGLFKSSPTAPIDTYCSGQNLTAGNITVQGTAQCCRVPGR